jgi:hypothetical protein
MRFAIRVEAVLVRDAMRRPSQPMGVVEAESEPEAQRRPQGDQGPEKEAGDKSMFVAVPECSLDGTRAAEAREFQALRDLFASLGCPLEWFPARGGCRELWQFDGGLYGTLVQLYLGRNGTGRRSVFGSIEGGFDAIAAGRGGDWDISATLDGWTGSMREWVERALAEAAAPCKPQRLSPLGAK